jgi:hypothetical protein
MKSMALKGLTRYIHKQTTFASLPYADGVRRRYGRFAIEALPIGVNTEFDTTPDEEQELARALKDDRLAKRVISMKEKKHPYGTVPELIMLDYLEERGERFTYQAQLFGGFRAGGLVPDFVVSRSGTGLALNIQGNFWHNVPGKRVKDTADKLRMLNTYYNGDVIRKVIFVWESRLMSTSRREVMSAALDGVEMTE